MNTLHHSILDTIGNTPIVRINNIGPSHVNLYAKVESFNPMGSVKDRMALAMIEDAEQRGQLQPGQTVVEATSGNTGIALAMVCAQKGYPLVITMAENFSVERRRLMRFLGARVVLTPASEKGSGMVRKAAELAARHDWFQPQQFDNPVNAEVHERTTAEEIIAAFPDGTLDYWISGFGTGGTFSGVSRGLQEKSPNTRIVLCEPDNSAIVASGIPQPRGDVTGSSESHPQFRPHLMQGWSPDFIPGLMARAIEERAFNEIVAIEGDDALSCARDLARREGILAGISGGATLAGALAVAKRAPAGSNLLCMLPDTGERYLSTPLFNDVPTDMSEEEIEISRSTVCSRFDNAPAVKNEELPPADELAAARLNRLIEDGHAPLTIIGLEWCEFCWSLRQALTQCGIEYKSVDLDAREWQSEDLGSRMRVALRHRTECNTFPQVFLEGEFIGGCTEVFDAIEDRSLFRRLENLGIAADDRAVIDPYTLLPGWLHPRG